MILGDQFELKKEENIKDKHIFLWGPRKDF
jgi:hypothetical protein